MQSAQPSRSQRRGLILYVAANPYGFNGLPQQRKYSAFLVQVLSERFLRLETARDL